MKTNVQLLSLFALVVCSIAFVARAEEPADNTLTAEEKAAGWKLLFDGKTLNGWRSYGKTNGPTRGWEVKDGLLNCIAHGKGKDIVSVDQFNDFDFRWDWMIPKGANNGIKYLVDEKRPDAPGHEYQMIDDSIAESAKQATASFYDVLAPDPKKPLHPPGEWNHSRVLLKGKHIEHWLNGVKVLEYELGSPEVEAALKDSKFKDTPRFDENFTSPILLTEHQDAASFKNLKILELK